MPDFEGSEMSPGTLAQTLCFARGSHGIEARCTTRWHVSRHDHDSSRVGLGHAGIFWLFIIGLLHGSLLWCFEVLRFYALWAVLLPLFAYMAPRWVLVAALSAGVLIPALVDGASAWITTPAGPAIDVDAMAMTAFASGSYREALIANWWYDVDLTLSVGQIAYQVAVFGRFLLGLYVARTFELGNLDTHRALLRRVLLVGGLLATPYSPQVSLPPARVPLCWCSFEGSLLKAVFLE